MNDAQMPAVRGPAPQGPPPGQAPKAEQNPLLLVHKLLRGRYIWAILLGGVLGLGGAAIGYLATPLKYDSTSVIQVAPVLPKILYENEENAMLPMYAGFLDTQMAYIRSRRVVEMAMQSPTWREAGGEYTVEGISEFTENLSVGNPRNSQRIIVTYTDTDPARARAAAKAVVDAYMSVYGENDQMTDTQRFQLLEERERSLSNEIDGLRERILDIANEFGSTNLEELYEFDIQEVQRLETELESAKLALAHIEAEVNGTSEDDDEPVEEPETLTIDELAAMDARMQQLLDERRALEWQVDEIEAVYKDPEGRTDYRVARQRLQRQQAEIAAYADQLRERIAENSAMMASRTPGATLGSPMATGIGMGMGMPVAGQEMTEEDLDRAQARVDRIQELYDVAKAETLELGRKNLQIQTLREEMGVAEARLNETRSRIEELSVESSLGGRISVLSEAEPPSGPSNSHKRLQFGVLGGMAGGGLGVGFILLIGFLNPRVRYISDAEEVRPRLLGALPDLPRKLNDPGEALIAAQCVHQIRTMLQAAAPQNGHGLALTVTSATSATGKTSLALSLGISFALAGTRTLIIDGDLVGTALTRRTGAVGRRKLGKLFREYGIISEDEARKALDAARRAGVPIGQSLTQLGYINDTDLQEGLAIQRDLGLGLADALRGEPLEDCIADIGMRNLEVLPASERDRAPLSGISRQTMTSMLDDLRARYDLVLIDTGPVPGPMDSSVMAACADGVIMVVSRGEYNAQVRNAIEHLHLVNAPLTGLVYNRARSREIERSGHSSSVGSDPAAVKANGNGNGDWSSYADAYADYGPLPQSVLAMHAEM